MIERVVSLIIEATFSVAVIAMHIIWFIWYLHHQDQANTVTNFLSWEAAFIALFIGYSQKKAHRNLLNIVRPKPKTKVKEELLPPVEIELDREEF